MRLKVPAWLRQILKATRFWQDNYLILREFKHFRWIAIAAIICTLLSAFFEGATVGLIASFLQGLTNPSEPPIQTGIAWFDRWFLATEASATARIYRLSGLIIVAMWARALLNYLGIFYSQVSQFNLADCLRKRVFAEFQSVGLSYYSSTHSGELINSIKVEVNRVKQAFGAVSSFITCGSKLVAYVIAMFLISWQLSIAAVLLFSLLSAGLSNLIARVREASFEIPKANGRFTSVVIEFINGIRTVRAAAAQDYELKRFNEATEGVVNAETKVASISASVRPVTEAVSSTILIVMVVVAFNLFVVDGVLKAASLLTFMFVLFRMMPLVSQVNGAREQFSRFQGSLHNLKELLRRDNKTYLRNGTIQFTGLKRSLDFESVDFGYDAQELVLCNITLSITKGETTALVGASGAGKSTLVDLIPRFYDPIQGRILIDGIDLKEFDINSLRNRMSVVSQDTFIFNNTVRYNLAYGLEGVADEAIWKVAEQANALEFILDLPDQLDTMLGDRGVRLSGGQRQRIAIARALLRNPDILILDEATSALDSITEKLIQESLEKLSIGRTVITIAHRLSTIERADKVVVLEQGQIVEQGRYQDLLARQGKLWSYHQVQSLHS